MFVEKTERPADFTRIAVTAIIGYGATVKRDRMCLPLGRRQSIIVFRLYNTVIYSKIALSLGKRFDIATSVVCGYPFWLNDGGKHLSYYNTAVLVKAKCVYICRFRVTPDNIRSVYTVRRHNRGLKLQTERDKHPTENIGLRIFVVTITTPVQECLT